MSTFRYSQFCPLARAAEILGERWTLLILRDLFVGPQRFSDLRRRLPGISASVLIQRIRHLESNGLVRRATLPPPGRADVVELTELGREFEAPMRELVRFGMRYLAQPEGADHFEPSWLEFGLAAVARPTNTPTCRFVVCIPDGTDEVVLEVRSGRRGVVVESVGAGQRPTCDALLRGDAMSIFAFASGSLSVSDARDTCALDFEGDLDSLAQFHLLFDLSQVGSAQTATPNTRAQ